MKTFMLIGCGNWAKMWLSRFIPQVADVAKCVAVADINPDAVEMARQALNLPKSAAYTDTAQALREHQVDFAVVAAAIPAHLTVVRTILREQPGCHILSEKPVAGCMEDCLEIERLVKEAGVKCAFTFSHRYEDDKQTFEKVLRSGKYGKVNTIMGRLMLSKCWRVNPPENLLIDGGVHYLDMLRSFTGSEAKTVYAQAWNCDWPERGGSAASGFVHTEMENGVRACLEFNLGGALDRNGWCNEYFRAECEKASVVLDRRVITARWMDEAGERREEVIPLLEGEHWKHDLIIRNFINWLDGGDAPDVCLSESMKAMALMCAAADSIRTGKAVPVCIGPEGSN